MQEFIQNVIENWEQYATVVAACVGAFAAIATVTPNKSDNKIADVLLKIVNTLGLNVGKASNDPRIK